MEYSLLPRAAQAALSKALATSPIVVVSGARQTGKTTLVRSHPKLSSHPYLTMDDFDLRALAQASPEAVLARAPALILDEVQRTKDLLIAVKRAVDNDPSRKAGRFVVTGSANLLMMESIGETLAGRAVYLPLWPLTRRERLGHGRAGIWSELLQTPAREWLDLLGAIGGEVEDWRQAVALGGFPVPAHQLRAQEERELWFSGYVQTYLERDLQPLRAVENLSDFRRLMRAACLRIGGLVNQTELGRDVGLNQPQVHRFMNVLEASYQLIRLSAYSVNRTKRLIKAPKIYWGDSGLAMHLSGESLPRGPHLENMILCDLITWRDLQVQRPEVLYWRTVQGQEVDFVVETPRRLLPIEVKAAARVQPADIKGLEAFMDEYPDLTDGALLLYAGTEVFPVSGRVLAVPWWKVC